MNFSAQDFFGPKMHVVQGQCPSVLNLKKFSRWLAIMSKSNLQDVLSVTNLFSKDFFFKYIIVYMLFVSHFCSCMLQAFLRDYW